MIDLAKAKKYFYQYTGSYDPGVSRIRLKITHIEHVAANSRKIAQLIGLSTEEQDLAELIGWLHDIGRFEQVRLYNTFADRQSINHAEKGVEVLFEDCEIRNFISSSQYDQIIKRAVLNHNKYKIDDDLSSQEQLFCKIIRDADKLDIFRDFLTEKLEDLVRMDSEDVSAEVLSPEFYQAFHDEKPLRFADCKTNMDFLVCILAFIYDFNFEEVLGLILEQNYIPRIIERIDAKDPYTRDRMKKLGEHATEYLKKHTIDKDKNL